MKNLTKNLSGCLMVALLLAAIYAVLAFMVQVFWNWLLPTAITFWQAALVILIVNLIVVLIVRKKGLD